MALVVVDAENTRRSQWPNVSREELVRRVREAILALHASLGAAPEPAQAPAATERSTA